MLFLTAPAQSNRHVGISALDTLGIRLSHYPGAYKKAFLLTITAPEGTTVRYKLGWDKETVTRSYYAPFLMHENTLLQLEIRGANSSILTYQGNYIIGRIPALPVICLKVTPEEFFPPSGIYYGYFSGTGTAKIRVGNSWKKKPIKCFAEFIYGGKSVFATSCQLKTFGGFTLALPEKSLHLVADTNLGASEFRYKFFPTKPFNEFEHLVLRTSGSDQNQTRFQDISLSSLAGDMGVDHMAYQPCAFYVNDKYFGIINLREKVNNDYLSYNHHALKDSTDLVESDGLRSKEYVQFMKELEVLHGRGDYQTELEKRMALENYLNFSYLQIYIANSDSRGNIRYWKSRNLDNRWRWIFYDSDLGCRDKYQNVNFLKERLSPVQTQWYNPKWTTHILRNIVADPVTRDRFINQICLMQATYLNHDTILSRIDRFASWIEPEIPYHVKRHISSGGSESRWRRHIQDYKDFFVLRKQTFHKHMCETFALSSQRVNVKITSNFPDQPLVTANKSLLDYKSIDGLFYTGRSLQVAALDRFPYLFNEWIEDSSDNSDRKIMLDKDILLTASFRRAPFDSALYGKVGIQYLGLEMKSKNETHWLALTNLSGKDLDLSEFTFHQFESRAICQIKTDTLWKDSSIIVLTNHADIWKRRHGEFTGTVLEVPLVDHFIQHGTWYVSHNGMICDSLHFDFSDSLIVKGDRWFLQRDTSGIYYSKGDSCRWSPLSFSRINNLPVQSSSDSLFPAWFRDLATRSTACTFMLMWIYAISNII
ncbi:MAG: CotH kinase family protein [Bacteroidota bacterium]